MYYTYAIESVKIELAVSTTCLGDVSLQRGEEVLQEVKHSCCLKVTNH